MINFPDYEYATNLAYQELMDYNGKFPVINVYEILSKCNNIKLCTYTQAAQKAGYDHNKFTYHIAQSEYGFTVSDSKYDKHIIYYNNLKDTKTIRFTLVHELGHIRMGHEIDNYIYDREANCFARNILCPVQIIDEFKLSTAKDYVECFNISEPMAKAAIGHFKSDLYYISNELYNKVNDKIYCYMAGYASAKLYGYA